MVNRDILERASKFKFCTTEEMVLEIQRRKHIEKANELAKGINAGIRELRKMGIGLIIENIEEDENIAVCYNSMDNILYIEAEVREE